MKTKEILRLAALAVAVICVAAAGRSMAQVDAEVSKDAEMRALLKERSGALDEAVEHATEEKARMAARRAATDPELRAKLDEAVRRGRPEESAEDRATRERAEAALDRAREGLSDEAKAKMALIVEPPVRALPVTPPDVPVKPADFGSAQPTQPERVEIAPKEVRNRVRVTAAGAAEFDSRTGIAIFTEDVVVEHPSFYLECDELEVHMSKDAAAEAKVEAEGGAAPIPPPAVPGAPAAEGAAAPPEKSGIDLAIAKGRRVLLKKKSEDGKLQIGICRYAVFDGATGDIEMKIWPQIQKGKELLKATSESTVIVIKQDGRMTTHGGGVALDANAKEVK